MSFRRLTLVLLLLATALTAVAMTAAPEANAVGCNAGTCTGRDPQVQGCSNDARTIDEFTFGARFEMRYSPACYAAWTRVTSSTHYNTMFAQIRSTNRSPNVVYGVQVTEGQHWTKMISFQWLVKTCRAVWFDASPTECTAAH